MAGTKEGGRKAAVTNKQKHGDDFYIRNGAKGGKVGKTGGFYANRELARKAGALGGRISRRTKNPEDLAKRRSDARKQLPTLGQQFGNGKYGKL